MGNKSSIYPLKLIYVSWNDLYQDKKRAPISECSKNKLITKTRNDF